MRSALLWIGLPLFIVIGGSIAIYQAAHAPLPSDQPAPAAEVQQSTRANGAPQAPEAQVRPRPVQQRQIAAQSATVYIAPYSGKRYHATQSCRGLSNARSVEAISLAEAERRGLPPCKICY